MNRRRITVAAVLAIVLAVFALSRAGVWLQVSDPLQPSDAIVVLGGSVPFRAVKGADLYKHRLAPEVWLTMGNRTASEAALEQRGIRPMLEYAYSQLVLERLGVPATAIRVIPGRNNNTATEMKTIAAFAQQRHAARLILVTSSYHSRRVRSLWHKLTGNTPPAIVQYTENEPFNAGRWWADTADVWRVSREWFGLVNAWLGFPVTSEHW